MLKIESHWCSPFVTKKCVFIAEDSYQNSALYSIMSESLSEEELAELIRSGRINTSRSNSKRRQTKTSISKPNRTQTSVKYTVHSPREVEISKSKGKEPDPEWLKTEKEKAERNIIAQRQDKQRQEEMQEASRF